MTVEFRQGQRIDESLDTGNPIIIRDHHSQHHPSRLNAMHQPVGVEWQAQVHDSEDDG